jgi:lipoprotein NlpI
MTSIATRCWLAFIVLTAVILAEKRTNGDDAHELVERAMEAADRGDNAAAIKLATQAIESDARIASAYYTRGREFFRTGRIKESLADFNKYVELQPQVEPQQWERGIAFYYAGQFEKGAAQFERYQAFDGHDVENSVWRFLCMVPQAGVPRAQSVMLPIENDRRIPMMQIYDLFRGKLQVEDVIAAAKNNASDEMVLASRLFYAHLYLGLWFDANGKKEEASRYIDLAADEKLKSNPRINRYMWDVARIHQKLLRGDLKKE